MALVFRYIEPFARSLWDHEIQSFASNADQFTWRTDTYVGGLYQRTMAQRPTD